MRGCASLNRATPPPRILISQTWQVCGCSVQANPGRTWLDVRGGSAGGGQEAVAPPLGKPNLFFHDF